MNSSDNGIVVGDSGNKLDVTQLENQFKKDKCRTKSNFTRSRNNLLLLVEEQDMPSRRAVKEACRKMDSCLELVMEVLTNFSDFYTRNGEVQKDKILIREMEKIEKDYYTAYEAAQEYLNSRKDDSSSITADVLSVDMLQQMNITNDTETLRKNYMMSPQQRTFHEEQNLDQQSEVVDCLPTTITQGTSYPYQVTNQAKPSGNVLTHILHEHLDTKNANNTERNIQAENRCRLASDGLIRYPTEDRPRLMNSHAISTGPVGNSAGASIGQDLWRQLKRVQIPVFSGDKRAYPSWRAAFIACIDSAPATGEYKLLQLRQYLAGEALKAIENLGHSAVAYEAAKERLDRKYGGKRRQIAIYLEDLEQFRQIRPGNAKDLDEFADLLDIALINLQEAGQNHELGDGSLYTKLQRKLHQSMLARYHRWVFETNTAESVVALRKWVIQEAEFQTIASETVHGLTGKIGSDAQTYSPFRRSKNQGAYFGDIRDSRSLQNS